MVMNKIHKDFSMLLAWGRTEYARKDGQHPGAYLRFEVNLCISYHTGKPKTYMFSHQSPIHILDQQKTPTII